MKKLFAAFAALCLFACSLPARQHQTSGRLSATASGRLTYKGQFKIFKAPLAQQEKYVRRIL
jgi:hypothetical protein